MSSLVRRSPGIDAAFCDISYPFFVEYNRLSLTSTSESISRATQPRPSCFYTPCFPSHSVSHLSHSISFPSLLFRSIRPSHNFPLHPVVAPSVTLSLALTTPIDHTYISLLIIPFYCRGSASPVCCRFFTLVFRFCCISLSTVSSLFVPISSRLPAPLLSYVLSSPRLV